MSLQDDRESQRRRRSDSDHEPSAPFPGARRKRPPVGEVGEALRTVYQRTVDEDIPPEMLDLLGKLG